MNESTEEDAAALRSKAIFEVALQTRNLEIGLLWQRLLFCWGLISAAFVAYAAAINNQKPDGVIAVSVASFGAICSLTWTLANRGSKYWQQSWESKLAKAESQALRSELFSDRYRPNPKKLHFWGQWHTGWHFSVSRLAIALSDLTFVFWLILVARAIPGPKWITFLNECSVFIIPCCAALYGISILFFARSDHDDDLPPTPDETEESKL